MEADVYRETDLETRAAFLEAISTELEGVGEELVERAMAETGLPRGRLEESAPVRPASSGCSPSEVREGRFQELRFDAAIPRASRRRNPTFVFATSCRPRRGFRRLQLPLAFSVAGGDTAPLWPLAALSW